MRSVKSENPLAIRILRDLVLILFIIIFVSVLNNFRNRESDTESALMADATASVEMKGVFIRDEEIKKYSGGGVVSYSVPDGGRLGNGTVIADIFDSEDQITRNREKEQLEKELGILKKIQNPGTLEAAQPQSLSASIEETYRNLIYCRDICNYETVSSDMDELLVLLTTYQIITDEDVNLSQRILDINNELKTLESSSVSPKETIISDRSAYFVSSCDGYESTLTKESIDKLTLDQLKTITDKTDTSPGIIGKLIEGYEWYMAGIIDNTKKEYAVGDMVKLRFETIAEDFKAVIVDIRDEGDPSQSIIIVSCDQFNYNLVQHRCQSVELVKDDYQGLKVPREAIRFKSFEETVTDENGIDSVVTKNYRGVYIREGEQVEFRKVDVIYEGSNYVLSAVHTEDPDYLSLYDDIMIEGVDSDGK